jgi:UDP-galactopyranose mutase
MNDYDFLIVGAGFSGAVLAERLNSIDKKVLVIEKRNHLGGNSYDYYDEHRVLVHKYGPHYFRTNDEGVFNYLSKFTKWRAYEYRIRTCVNGILYPIPINRDTLNEFFKVNLKSDQEARDFLNSKRIKIDNPKNAEEQVLSTLGKEIYENFFKNYTIKQWNTAPKNLHPSVTSRIPYRYNTDDKYFNDKIQVMPANGYFNLFENLLNGIEIRYNTNYFDNRNNISYKNLIYTGPIDLFFNYKYGKLPYRSLNFSHENYDQEFYQDWVQINYPNNFDYTRIVEIKHATGQNCKNTTIVKEFPSTIGEPFYPIPNNENINLYLNYKKEVDKLKNTFFIGRLATYQYLNMDEIVREALDLFESIKY